MFVGCMLLKMGFVGIKNASLTFANKPRWWNLEFEHKSSHKMSNIRPPVRAKNDFVDISCHMYITSI